MLRSRGQDRHAPAREDELLWTYIAGWSVDDVVDGRYLVVYVFLQGGVQQVRLKTSDAHKVAEVLRTHAEFTGSQAKLVREPKSDLPVFELNCASDAPHDERQFKSVKSNAGVDLLAELFCNT